MTNVVKVVVFTPPPHEPGEAPINIKRIRTKSVSFAKFPIDSVLNPAVLALIAWKNPAKWMRRFGLLSE